MVTIPPGLKEAIEEDDLVLFIGAGLSWDLKNIKNEFMGGWDKMVKSLTSHLNDKSYITNEDKRSCDALEPIKALKIIQDKGVNKSKVANFIKYYFALGKGNDLSLFIKRCLACQQGLLLPIMIGLLKMLFRGSKRQKRLKLETLS